MTDRHAHTIAHAIARARGHAEPPHDRALRAELEAISRRLATIEARVTIITTVLAALAASSAAPALAAIVQGVK